jgi:hypothetical protein
MHKLTPDLLTKITNCRVIFLVVYAEWEVRDTTVPEDNMPAAMRDLMAGNSKTNGSRALSPGKPHAPTALGHIHG